jgi:uncharacterized protein YbbC (DUF1343 family)
VRFEAVDFLPQDPGDGKWRGTLVHGVRFVATEPAVYDPTHAAVAALVAARRMSGIRWEWNAEHFDRLAGTDRLRAMIEAGLSAREIVASWDSALDGFERLRERYLIYR